MQGYNELNFLAALKIIKKNRQLLLKSNQTVSALQSYSKLNFLVALKIIKLVAAEGAAVKAGEVLLILEAMKMQNEITADADGTVKKFNVSAGQSAKAHESLVILG